MYKLFRFAGFAGSFFSLGLDSLASSSREGVLLGSAAVNVVSGWPGNTSKSSRLEVRNTMISPSFENGLKGIGGGSRKSEVKRL